MARAQSREGGGECKGQGDSRETVVLVPPRLSLLPGSSRNRILNRFVSGLRCTLRAQGQEMLCKVLKRQFKTHGWEKKW